MKKRILSSCVLALSLGISINTWSELPGLDTVKPIRTYDVGQSADDTNVVIMNHNKDHQVLLVELDGNNKHVAFAVADLSVDVSETEVLSHLKSSYLTGDKAGFLDSYPNPPVNLSSYTSLSFDSTSTADDFSVVARKMIVAATGYLQSQNLSIPWQQGYAALKINDDFIAVDDISEGSTNGYFKCDLDGWQSGSSVSNTCSTVDTDYSFLDLLGNSNYHPLVVDRGTSASPYVSLDTGKVDTLNLKTGERFQTRNYETRVFYTEESVANTYTHKDRNIPVLEVTSSQGTQSGIFVVDSVAFIGSGGPEYAHHEHFYSNGEVAIFVPQTWDGGDLSEVDSAVYSSKYKVCDIQYKQFSLGEDPFSAVVDLNLTRMNRYSSSEFNDPSIRLIFESYYELPTELEELEELNTVFSSMGADGAGFYIDSTTTLQEYKDFLNTNLLAEIVNDLTSEKNQELYGNYFACIDTPKSIDAHFVHGLYGTITLEGSLINASSYWASPNTENKLGMPSSYVMTLGGEFESHTGVLFSYLTEGINSTHIEAIQQNLAITFDDLYGSYPSLPSDKVDDNEVLYKASMENHIVSKIYNAMPVLGSVASNDSVLLGNILEGLPVFGQSSKSSYLIYKKELPKNTVRIIPDRLIIDPYDDASLNTRIELEVEGLYGAELTCTYNSDNLFYQNSHYGSLFPASPLSFQFPIMPSDGSWMGRALLLGSPTGLTELGDFAEINYQVAETTAEVELSCIATLSDAEGNALPVVVESARIKIDDGIHGLVGESGNVEGSIDLPSSVEGQEVTVTVSIDGRSISSSSLDGSFSFEQLRDGVFTMTVNSDNHVAACTTVEIINGEVVSVEELELIAGDVTGDGIIDIGDISAVSAKYGLTSSDDAFDEIMDLNRDGLINIQDISIIGSHFNSVNCIQ